MLGRIARSVPGEKHPNHLLAFTQQGRRRCLYIPKAMVPALKHALENGRRIERLPWDRPCCCGNIGSKIPHKLVRRLRIAAQKEAKILVALPVLGRPHSWTFATGFSWPRAPAGRPVPGQA